MRFLRAAWRLLVGVKDALVLVFMLLFFGALYAALSAGANPATPASGALHARLDGVVVEQPAEPDPFSSLSGGQAIREFRLRDLVRGLEVAATDDTVKAVALDLDTFLGGGQASLADVAEALDNVRRNGKRVVAYATGYTDDGYQLAAHADEIWLNPQGAVLIQGPGGPNLYYKGLLDKLGVTANVYRVGEFKSAVEPYIRNDQSPEARAQSQALSGALWRSWLDGVQRARPRARIAQFAANPVGVVEASGGDLAQAAVRAGLVDKLGDRVAWGRRVGELAGRPDKAEAGEFNAIPVQQWAQRAAQARPTGTIGVATVAGTIVDGQAGPGTAGGDTIAKLIEQAVAEKDLRALVLRVDSPGGSALASERIRQAVLAARARKLPVVVSMGSVAASGGYWVATAGDHIMAEPSTITGSIGVFGVLPSFQGSLEKLGVGADGVKTTPLSGEPDLLRGPSPEASRLVQLGVEGTYRRFLTLVSQNRRLPVARINELGGGRVYDGSTARQLGLVDSFGDLDDAIARAAQLAKLGDDYAPLFLDRPQGWRALLAGAFQDDGGEEQQARDPYAQLAGAPTALLARALADVRQLLGGSTIQARCLECGAHVATPAPPPGKTALEASLWQRLLG